jgi:hypothetical protein
MKKTKYTVLQLIIGSFKNSSVNGINNLVKLRNTILTDTYGMDISYLRVDSLKSITQLKNDSTNYDFVFVDSFYSVWSIIIAEYLKVRFRTKKILWSHGAFNIHPREYHKKFYLRITRLMKFDKVLVCGKSEIKSASDFCSEYFVVGNGVLTKQNIRKKSFINFERIVYLGRFDPFEKGFDRMWSLLVKKPTLLLDIYGKGKSFDVPKELLNRVSVNPPVFGDEKDSIIESCGALILLSRREGMPMSILESLVRGTPVIVSHETNTHDFYGSFYYLDNFDLKQIDRDKISTIANSKFDINIYARKIFHIING